MTFSTDWATSEAKKYEEVWRQSSYREQADGDPVVDEAYARMGCQPSESLIDWGCGKGGPAVRFQSAGLVVTGFDIAANCLDDGVVLPLVVGCLWDPPKMLVSDYAFCTDVLEHIPPEYLEACLDVLVARTHRAAYIQIDTFPDLSGPRMDPPQILHLSLHSREWWLAQLRFRWRVVESTLGLFTRWRFLCLK